MNRQMGATSRRVVLMGLALALSGGSAWLGARQEGQPPAFRSGTDVVRLEVSVLDRDRHPVRGLTADDFVVEEDGRPRPIVAFTPVELPPPLPAPTASWMHDAPHDVVTNTDAGQGRLVVIAFDWSLRSFEASQARRIAVGVIDALRPGDQAAVVFTSGIAGAGVPQNFTSDRTLLRSAIEQPFATAELNRVDGTTLEDPERYFSGNCRCGTCTMDGLTQIAHTLEAVSQHPKVVVLITGFVRTYEPVGSPRPTPPIPGRIQYGAEVLPGACSLPLKDARRQFDRAMAAANVTVHVIDPVGLETSAMTPLGVHRIRERQDSLPVLADMTGGRTIVNTDAPELQIPAILDETSAYYVLGFAPAASETDRRSHAVRVRVRPRGLTVRARARYTLGDSTGSEPTTAGDAQLVHALGGVLPAVDVPFAAAAVPLVTGDRTTTIVVGRLSASPAEAVTLLTAAFTPYGHAAASTRIRLPPTAGARPESDVFGIMSGLSLDPGRYEIRIAAELASGASGSVNTYVDVPDFRHSPLTMSGVLLHVEPGEPTAAVVNIQSVLPVVPTARRAFDPTDRVSAYVQISQGTERTEALVPVIVRLRVRNAQDVAVADQSVRFDPAQFATDRIADATLSLPLQGLPAGEYLFSLDAGTSGGQIASRSVRLVLQEENDADAAGRHAPQ